MFIVVTGNNIVNRNSQLILSLSLTNIEVESESEKERSLYA